jgi:hypothetical protein
MRRSLFRKTAAFGLSLVLIGNLFAYADSVSNSNPTTLSADGQLTPRTRAIISGEYAYLLGQPEIIAPDIRLGKIVRSPEGESVLITAYKQRPFRGVVLDAAKPEPTVGEFNLIHWDARTRVARTLLRESVRDDALVSVEQIEWLPQTRTALVVLCHITVPDTQHPERARFAYSLLRVDASTGKVSRIAELGVDNEARYSGQVSVSASPSRPIAYVISMEKIGAKSGPLYRSTLRVYTPQGLRVPIALPDGVAGIDWMSDGKSVWYDSIVERSDTGKVTVRKQLTLVNLETGEVTQPDKLPVVPKAERAKETPSISDSWGIEVATANTALQTPAGKAQPASALWLQAKAAPKKTSPAAVPPEGPLWADSVLVATNSHLETSIGSDDTGAILFTRDGSLCAAPIFRLPAAAFEQALRRVQRTATMQNAKQIGVAVMMYSQDYDETLPLPGSGVQDAVGPYLKNPSVFENPGTGSPGFTYSYSGSTSQSAMGQPATTQLGYVSGPGGRAIIWADGHVTWQDQ